MNDWRKHFLFYSIIAMLVSLFLSRALLSVSMLLFVLVSFLHDDSRGHIRSFLSSPVLWGMTLLFILPFISGLWSEDKQEWLAVLRIKLPLLLLPLAFASPFGFSRKRWNVLAYIFIGLVTLGALWSLFRYAGDMQAINESYLRAKSIPTPLGNDHVRFSWLVSSTILLCALMAWYNRSQHKMITAGLSAIAVLLTIFLHLLAARTGLFSFYIMLLATGVWLILQKAKPLRGVALLFVLVLLPCMAYHMLPSFHNRVRYILYDYSYFSDMRYLPGGNDATRVIAIRAGWNLLRQYPLAGTGAGDIAAETSKWEQANYPGIVETDMHYPSSEWLIYGLTFGWTGLLLFTVIMLIPFFVRRKPALVWILLHATAAFSFLFDMGLEVQFGVFIYSFIVLWWWKWFLPQKKITLNDD